MTLTDTAPSSTEPPKKCGRRKCLIGLLVALLVVAGGSYYFSTWFIDMHGGAAQNSLQLQQKLNTAESRLEALEAQISEMRTRLDKFEAEPATAETKGASKQSSTELARLQNDMIALSSAMSALQMEVKQTGNLAGQAQLATQSSVAAAVAFVQLREAANSGRGFEDEFDTLKKAAKNDATFQEQLAVLEPHAEKGIPTVASLNEELLALEASAMQATARATAQSWWERVLAELKGLISIRPLHGAGAPDTLAALENNVAKGDMNAVLEEIKNLDPEAQKILAAWQTKVEARQKIDAALQIMGQRFVARAEPKPAKKDEP